MRPKYGTVGINGLNRSDKRIMTNRQRQIEEAGNKQMHTETERQTDKETRTDRHRQTREERNWQMSVRGTETERGRERFCDLSATLGHVRTVERFLTFNALSTREGHYYQGETHVIK